MAVVPMQKIGLLTHKEEKEQILSFLQEKGVMHLENTQAGEADLKALEPSEDLHGLYYKVAELDFAIKFLSSYEVKKKGLQSMVDGDSVKASREEVEEVKHSFNWKPVVEKCKELEESMVDLENEKKSLADLQDKLKPWSYHPAPLDEARETGTSVSIFGMVSMKDWEALRSELIALSELLVIEMDNIVGNGVYFQIICAKSLISDVEGLILSYKGELVDLPVLKGAPQEEIQSIDRRFHEIGTKLTELKETAKKEASHLKHLRILFDALNWELERKESDRKCLATESTVLLTGWVPEKGYSVLKRDMQELNPNFELFRMTPEEGESAPVLLANKPFLKPFESVTGIYGLPLANELDPTPYLSIFFIVFFGLALTDAVYGLLLFAVMFSVLKFLKIPKQSQGLLRLLMYAGIVTFFAGALFGGWASMDASQAPSWLTTTDANGELIFIGQKINAIKDPMSVLILSFILGYIQVLFGVILNFVHKFKTQDKKDALIGDFPWVFILAAIGLFVAVKAGVLPESLAGLFQVLLYIAIAGIVLTQGREKKNPVMKLVSGILGLYGLVGYLSDVLSYSRLLALGLATAIIGLAVNTIAGMVNGIPVVGIVLAIIVLAGGHIFNLGINALGAFIHSGRLQFVEFFTKFLEGGGRAFSPLRRESRYIRVNETK